MSNNKLRNDIGVLLLDKPMSLNEVAEVLGIKKKKAYTLLSGMYKKDRINTFKDVDGIRRYRCTEEEREAALKRKARAEKRAAKKK